MILTKPIFKINGNWLGSDFFEDLASCIWRTDMARINPKGAIFSCSLCGYTPTSGHSMWFKNDFYAHYTEHFLEYAKHKGIDRYDGFYIDHDFFEFTRKLSIIKQFRGMPQVL